MGSLRQTAAGLVPRPKPMASLVRGAMLAMAMTVATTGAPGQAAYAAEAGFAASQNYSIAPGPLSPALSRFALPC